MRYFEAHDITEYRDANGQVPEILMVDGNRAAGKTTAFSRKFVDDFKATGKKFMLLYRYANELTNISESFFKDIKGLFFPDDEMTDKTQAHGAFIELFLNGKSCGYAAALNTAGKLKHYSHIFSDVGQILFDEYQLENGFYIQNEIQKFISIHMTVARGQGQVVRFVPVYMLSNSVSIFNPYYEAFGIAERINSRTKQLKGDGWVLLRLMLQEVAKEQEKSAFNRAFAGSRYTQAATDNSFLNDDTYNIRKRDTTGLQALFCFYSDGETFQVYGNRAEMYGRRGGVIPDVPVYGAQHHDRTGDIKSIQTSGYLWAKVRVLYQDGAFTFDSPKTKRAVLRMIFDRL